MRSLIERIGRRRLEVDVGGSLAGAEREQELEELGWIAGGGLRRGGELQTLAVDKWLVALILQGVVDIQLGDPALLDEDLPEKPSGALLLAERLEELRRLELLITDQDLAQPVQAALEHRDLVLERSRR